MDIRNLGWFVTFAAFSTLSCGDAVPPPAEGAVSMTLTNSSAATTGSCSAHTLSLAGADTRPDSVNTGELLVDGNDGANVSCKVKGNGTYSIVGRITHRSNSFNISGTISSDGTGTATVSFWDGVLYESLSDPNCVVSLGSDTDNYTIDSGAIWANVKCPNLTTPATANISCAANATIVFRSCND